MIANSFTAEELCAHGESLRALARDLLADDDLAGDVVQQAYAAALARPPASRSTLSVWLRTVVRHCALDLRRTEHRRSVRERIAARPEAIAGADTAERFELQQDILAAVRGLGEPYCTVVWLRYYEQCSPAQIAARLRAPVKTIKTRLWRALGLLRQRLDSRYGDRRGWMLLLAPLDRIDSGSVTLATVVTTGAILMQGKKIALAIAAGIMAVAGVGLFWPDADARLASEGAAAVTPVVAAPTVGAGAEATPDRHVVAAESRPAVATPEPYGSLLVRVTWHDGTPAADVAIAFRAEAEPALDRNDLRAVSDAAGLARAHRLHAGAVTLTSDRGGEVKAEVAAGAAREVPFVLPAGIDVTGIVEDDRQQPVAGAHVFLAAGNRGWLTNRIVATTAGDGAFAVRAVLPRAALGAIATGFAPSSLVYLDTIDRQDAARSADVRLRLLRRGATVEGRVTDEHGQGVASALVAVGRGFDGNMHRSSRFGQVGCPEVATSDGKGNFHCDGVEPGRHPIMVRADGYALWSEQVDCAAGETTKVAVELSRGVTVQGTVRNEKGEVVADAVVMSVTRAMEGGYLTTAPHDYAAAFARPDTRSDAAGRYRLQWVPPGELHLLAGRWSDGNRGTKLEGSCQETL
ncbi:MAG TPA: sigma-70 family RNA polymerase sigma factor, partial [Planctomycetota bacterium]|nr:sigma-70 family RNA polymerase sigma factor [Planctomycetota bacterium]